MPINQSVLELIGNTPMIQAQRLDTGCCELFLKLESHNPGRLDQGPHRPVDDRGGRDAPAASSPATRWSKAPPAIPASGWPWLRSRRATSSSWSCRTR
jgi:hypothetical protein